MRKKSTAIVLILCIVLSLFSGCSDAVETAPPETTEPVAAQVTETAAAETIPETQPETEPETQPQETEPDYVFFLIDDFVELTEKGETLELYSGDVPVTDISWTSSDESIALFSQGIVVAVNSGTAVVSAQYRGQTLTCEVQCNVDPDAPAPYIPRELLQATRMGLPYVEDMEDVSFFDDVVFVGDSVSYVLQQWNLKNGGFGNALFLTRSSLGLQNSIDGRIQLSYQGRSYSPEDALAAVGAKKLFVMLGVNDLALFGIEGTMERWEIFIGRILEKCPDIEIYIQSCTPVHAKGEYSKLNNEIMDAYNAELEKFCQENGFHFVNIAPYFKDYNNSLATKYCSDNFVHLTYEGTAAWERILKAYAAEQMRLEAEGEAQ